MQSDVVNPETKFGNNLKFTPYAWAKLLYMRDRGDTEVAGYGVTGTKDPLLVTDFVLVKQKCTYITFDLDPEDGAEYMERMLDEGLMPWQYSNILIHTHPGNSPSPSGVDEENFKSAFSHPNWAIMFIIAEGGSCYCRLKVNIGPGSINELKVGVDWQTPFCGSNPQEWEDEYKDKVSKLVPIMKMTGKEELKITVPSHFRDFSDDLNPDDPDSIWWNEEENRFGNFSDAEKAELDRLCESTTEFDTDVDFNCHWDSNGDVAYWDEETDKWFIFDPVIDGWWSEKDDDDGAIEKIDRPKGEWVQKVEEWALEFSHERNMEIEV